MKVISVVRTAQCDNLIELNKFVLGEVLLMQRSGLEVEVQYSAIDKYNYTAMLLGYDTVDR